MHVHVTKGATNMSQHEIAALREAARKMYQDGKLLTGGEALTGACWVLLLVLCVLHEAAEMLPG